MRQDHTVQDTIAADTFGLNIRDFTISLKAANRAPRTIKCYLEAAQQFHEFCRSNGMPMDVEILAREHVESYIGWVLERWTPGTGINRYRSLQQFFKWLDENDRLPNGNPMAKTRPPKVEPPPVPVLSEADEAALLATCSKGKSFDDRRDYALLQVFVSTGARLGEVAGLMAWREVETREGFKRIPGDVDLEGRQIFVMGKGGRPRNIPLRPEAVDALSHYEYQRRKHPEAGAPGYWLGNKGPMTDSGIRQVARRRARQAGIPHLHPHMFRHGFAHRWLVKGGSGEDLQRLAGWRSAQMLTRYGASRADERARLAYDRIMGGGR